MQRRKPKSLQQTVGINLKSFTLWVEDNTDVVFKMEKKTAENLIKDEKVKKVVTSAIAAALAFVGGLIVKGLGNK